MNRLPPINPDSKLPWEDNEETVLKRLSQKAALKSRVSIVMPLYNSGKHLERTIRSLTFNDLSNVELIVCDNESTDETPSILNYYSQLFSHIIIRKDKGQSDALNHGFRLATGQIYGWLNGDDILLPNALTFVRKRFLQQDDADFCVGNAFLVEEDLSKISQRKYTDNDLQFSSLIDYAFNHLIQPSVFFKRQVWEQCGPLDVNDHYAMDADLFISMSKSFNGVAINKPLAYSVYHKACKTRANRWDSIVQLALVQSKHGGIQEAKRTLEILKTLPLRVQSSSAQQSAPQITNVPSEDEIDPEGDFLATTTSSNSHDSPKVALVCTSLSGGAGIACRRMHDALISAGIFTELYAIFPNGHTSAARIPFKAMHTDTVDQSIEVNEFRRRIWEKNIYTTLKDPLVLQANELFSTPNSDIDWDTFSATLNDFDIIHFHWSPGLINYASLPSVLVEKIVFITLHDMNFFTGGCHYSEGCNQYQDYCISCPQLLTRATEASHALKLKAEFYNSIPNLTVIAPSIWMRDKALASRAFKMKPVYVVNNFVCTNKFQPRNSTLSRIELGLPLNSKLILIGAESLENKRKGGHLLERLDREFQVRLQGKHDYKIVIFGRSTIDLGNRTVNLSYIEDESKMNLVYSSCDCFCFLSLEENAPQTVAESLLSGCPVVSFPIGNIPDVIDHQSNGYLAPLLDIREICNGVEWSFSAASSPIMRLSIAEDARRYYSESTVLDSHLKLYQDAILNNQIH